MHTSLWEGLGHRLSNPALLNDLHFMTGVLAFMMNGHLLVLCDQVLPLPGLCMSSGGRAFNERGPRDARNQDNWLTLQGEAHWQSAAGQAGWGGAPGAASAQGPPAGLHRGSALLPLGRVSLVASPYTHAEVCKMRTQPSCITLAAAGNRNLASTWRLLPIYARLFQRKNAEPSCHAPTPTWARHPGGSLSVSVQSLTAHLGALLIFSILGKSPENMRSVH